MDLSSMAQRISIEERVRIEEMRAAGLSVEETARRPAEGPGSARCEDSRDDDRKRQMTVAEALATARRARGITQEELSHRVSVTQASLSRYESGLREPDTSTLGVLARELELTPDLLQSAGRMQGALVVDAHMRRRRTAKATVWRRLEAQLNLYRLHARRCLDHVELETSARIPSFDPFDVPPEDAARLMRMQWRIPAGPVRHLVSWMESAGCLIIDEPFGTPRVDGLSQWVDDSPVILLNADAPTDRRRLTLAYELGHLCLHHVDVTEDVEGDATTFAAEFLMPAETIRPQLRNLNLGKLHDLKRYWGVSMQALIERAYTLGTLGMRERTNLYKGFSARGWRVQEPLSDQLPPEIPSLLTQISQSFLDRGLTRNEIAVLAGIEPTAQDNPFLPRASTLRAL